MGACRELVWASYTSFAPALLCKKREGKAQSAGHNGLSKLCNVAPAFFMRNPRGRDGITAQPVVTLRLQSLLCCAARASIRLKAITVAARQTSVNRP